MGAQYKDHPVTGIAAFTEKLKEFSSMLMDKKSKKPTLFGWIFLVMLAFILFRFASQGGDSASERDVAKRPDSGRFQVQHQPLAPDAVVKDKPHDPQEKEFEAIMQHNQRGDGPLKIPEFDPNKHKDMHEHDPEKIKHMERFGRPDPKDFPVGYFLQPRLDCPEGRIQLIVLVSSRPDGTGERAAIRRTWGNHTHQNFPHIDGVRWRTIFVMGMTETRFDGIAAKENQQHGDILQGQIKESPFEGTRKFLLGLKWLNEHMDSCMPHYILKTSDNIFHNMHAIIEWLDHRFPPTKAGLGTSGLYLGKLLRRDRPVRNEKDPMYVSETDFAGDVFPDMIEGPEYLFSADVFVLLNGARRKVTPVALEDAMIGLLASAAGVKPNHNDHFQMLKRPRNICHMLKMFFIFKVYPYEHLEIFREMQLATRNGACPNAGMIDLNNDGSMQERHIDMT